MREIDVPNRDWIVLFENGDSAELAAGPYDDSAQAQRRAAELTEVVLERHPRPGGYIERSISQLRRSDWGRRYLRQVGLL
jgi:hypothetical protein